MPLTRYQIRNEYSLADPELYRAADKDDPEALLEGVAMAGLVGVLRQLGDLAEFAAEIFHDLHEEVMATAARGHGLMIRVQQLEAEFPSIEKAFLSQTSHSLFLYNAGVDRHPNLRLDQNLITRGDLPRFVMDSYEECRGPPRLFLLEKFDIAGAGSCQKRYSDPSFFKTEFTSSETTKAEVQREKRARKIKKKVPRWKNGETPEVFPTSHAKLHQLFSEERSQTESNAPTNRVKLKRRQSNGSLFDLTTGKSYMERFLETPSPECKVVFESYVGPPLLQMASSNSSKLDPEINKISTRSPSHKLVQRDSSPVPSPSRQENVRETSMDELGEDVFEGEILKKLPEPTSDIELENTPSFFYKVEDQKESVFDQESKIEASGDGYRSDDISSEVDNYLDALTTMESEMETDNESRPKNGQGFFHIGKKGVDSDSNKEQQELQAQFSDSHSIGSSTASDDGNNSFKKGRFSLSYSDTLSNLGESVPSDADVAAKVHPSTEVCPAEIVDISSKKLSENGDVLGTTSLEYVVPNGTCNEVSEIPSYTSEFREASCNSCVTDSTSVLSHICPGASSSENQLMGHDTIEISSGFIKSGTIGLSLNAEEDGKILVSDLLCTSNVSDLPSQSRDDLVPVGYGKSQPVEMLDCENPDVSCDALVQLSNILDVAREKKDDDNAYEEMLPTEDSEDSCTENLINGKFDSPHAVTLHTEAQFHGLAAQNPEACSGITSQPECIPDSPTHGDLDDVKPDGIVVEIENFMSSPGEKSVYLTSAVVHPETGDLVEQKFPEMTDEVTPLEFNSAEVGISCSEVETLYNNLEVLSNMSDCEVKDGPAPDRFHLNSFGIERNTDAPLDFLSGCTISDTPKLASETEVHSQLANLITDTIPAEADDDDTVLGRSPIVSPSGVCIMLQEECLSSNEDSDQDKLEITEASSPTYLTGSDAQKEASIQLAAAPTDFTFDRCNPESLNPSDSEVDDHDPLLVEHTQNLMHPRHVTKDPLALRESDQESELKQPPQSHLSESAEDTMSPPTYSNPEHGALLEQALELQADECNVESDHQSEQTPSPDHVDRESSSVDPLSQPSEPEFSPLPTSMNPFHSIFPSFGLLPETTHKQLSDPQPFSGDNVPQGSLEKMPPLPPLPPIQWRIGKLQHGSLTSAGEMFQPSFNPFSSLSPATAHEKGHQGFPTLEGELAQPLNPFLPLPPTDDGKPQHGSQMLGREMVQPSQNPFSLVPAIGDEKIPQDFITSEGKIAQPQNPFLPLPTIETEKPQNSSLNFREQMVQPSLNSFTPSPTIENVSPQHASLASEAGLAQPLNTLAAIPFREGEKPRRASLTLEGEMVQPLNSSTSSTTTEDEKPQHDSLTLEGEMAWQLNSSSVLPTAEDGKPNGSLQAWLARPRDPLIEAVASHDKSTLRKVTERVQPQIGPKADERDSLLEQIRTKSFNLKPAVVTRLSVQGPKTNLKVAAILEKANAIRQALAGSDEDDDGDSWSDS